MRQQKRMRSPKPIQQQQLQQLQQRNRNRNRNRNQQANQRRRVGSTTGGRPMRQNNRATRAARAACEVGLTATSTPTTLMLLLLLALLLPLQLLVPTQATPSPSSMQSPQKRGEQRLYVILCYSPPISSCCFCSLVPATLLPPSSYFFCPIPATSSAA